MKKETKNEVKKNVATGASTAAGATAGVIIGTIVTPNTAEAAEIATPEPTPQSSTAPKPITQAAPETTPQQTPVTTPTSQNNPVTGPGQVSNEIEVLGFERVTSEDGSQIDVALVSENGNEVGYLDVNLDGVADIRVCDRNQNEVFEEGEYEIVQGQGIAMQPFADAAGFNPQYAQNEFPDYVNDADVDTYMA